MTPVQLFELIIGMFGVVLLLHYFALQLRLLPAERLLRSCAKPCRGREGTEAARIIADP